MLWASGQQLKTYNHGCALYRAVDVAREDIFREWEDATDKLAAQIPWLTKQVVHTDVRPGNTGKFHVAPWPPDLPPDKMLRVKGCTERLPSYQELHDTQFPVQKLDGKIILFDRRWAWWHRPINLSLDGRQGSQEHHCHVPQRRLEQEIT